MDFTLIGTLPDGTTFEKSFPLIQAQRIMTNPKNTGWSLPDGQSMDDLLNTGTTKKNTTDGVKTGRNKKDNSKSSK